MFVAILAVFKFIGPAIDANGQPMFTMQGHGAKVFLFHMPCAWLTSGAYVAAAWYAWKFLWGLKKNGFQASAVNDLKCAAATELGLLFGVLTTVTGSIFSKNEWGAYWSWDPRQTSILVVLLLLGAYLALRGAVADPEQRGRLCSAYSLIALVPGQFLIFVLPRIVSTLHEGPNKTVLGGMIGGNYRLVLYTLVMPAFIALFVWMFQLRLRALKLLAEHEFGDFARLTPEVDG
jgi:heme exporter protein C